VENEGTSAKSEKLGARSQEVKPVIREKKPDVEKIAAPRRKRPMSLEMPDYLARALKIKAASNAVTVRHLILSALHETGYHVEPEDLEEDGRRLR